MQVGIKHVDMFNMEVAPGKAVCVIVMGTCERPKMYLAKLLPMLTRRRTWLDGIMIAGDDIDPLDLDEDLIILLEHIKEATDDLPIALNTAGYPEDELESLVECGLVDIIIHKVPSNEEDFVETVPVDFTTEPNKKEDTNES